MNNAIIPADWKIRRALPADLEAILAVEQACDEAPHWSHDAWQRALAEDESSGPVRVVFLAQQNEEIIGFAVVSHAGEVAELESVAVHPKARRRGIGHALCREGMGWSRTLGVRVIELEVRAASAGALALYRALGFAEQGRRKGYYRSPTDDAVLMSAML